MIGSSAFSSAGAAVSLAEERYLDARNSPHSFLELYLSIYRDVANLLRFESHLIRPFVLLTQSSSKTVDRNLTFICVRVSWKTNWMTPPGGRVVQHFDELAKLLSV